MGNINIIKEAHPRRYAKKLDLTSMDDKTLSAQAKAIHIYIMTSPLYWTITFAKLVEQFTNGDYSIRQAIKELERTGYLLRERTRRVDGKWGTSLYTVYSNNKQKDIVGIIDMGKIPGLDPEKKSSIFLFVFCLVRRMLPIKAGFSNSLVLILVSLSGSITADSKASNTSFLYFPK